VESVAVMDTRENSPAGCYPDSFFKRLQASMSDALQDPASRTQVIRFCAVGILNTIVGYGAFFILVNYLYYLVALLIAHIIGVIHSFFWNKYWIFKTIKINLVEFIKFNIIYVIVLVVNAVALFTCVDVISVDPRLAQLILLPIITGVSFFGQKLWTFKANV
jgi:putative flippase GtrA